ncbi:hypothetical protein P1P68_22245 [Streptomyces scabiei]|uniref:hypothetical protein n=1 Tax=Streptomyces scabiei TaxID=1930 RepID=UPI00298F436B|nr:hypothetical protein [Streptomyces scabiei]MDW8807431.1 hypothetical protein [Streptomyces scabiei]
MNYVTFGGVTIGICILVHQLVTWWPGRKALMKDPARHAADLIPFLLSWAYGALTTLGVGGLVGLVSGTVLGLSNWLGDVALVWGVGADAGQPAARTTFVPLSGPGVAVMLILTVGFLAAAKKSRHAPDLKRGAWCGICLGTSAGVAGFAAAPLAQAVSWLGNHLYGAF